MELWVLFVLFNFVHTINAAIYKLSDEEYAQLPPLNSMEPFKPCLSKTGGRYCSAYATYVADDDNPLLTLMKEYSAHTSVRYNHSRAFFGVCLTNTCQEIEGQALDSRTRLEACLNRTISEKYNLKVKIDELVHCHDYGEEKPKTTIMAYAVLLFLLILMMLNVIGSFCHILFPNQEGFVNQFLRSFSIIRNWKKLTGSPEITNTRLERIKGINGIRAISMILVVVAHTFSPVLMYPENPKFIEDLYDTYPFYLLLNGSMIMQTFFFLSGFLFFYTKLCGTEEVTWKVIPVAILKRLIRFTMANAVMIAFIVTWLPRLSAGPIWDAWRPLYWAAFPLAVAIILACKPVYPALKVEIEYRVAQAALVKPVFGFLIGIIVVGMIFKVDDLYRGILEWNGWVSLSHVSYSVYLVNIACIEFILLGGIDQPIRMSYVGSGETMIFPVIMTYIVAYIFWLTVEAPLAELANLCFRRKDGAKRDSKKIK